MNLEVFEIERTEKIRSFILKNLKSEEIEKLKCEICNGTGMSNIYRSMNDEKITSWDGNSFCDDCGGTGFSKGEIQIGLLYRCPKCKGVGVKNIKYNKESCSFCNGVGFTDWLGNCLG